MRHTETCNYVTYFTYVIVSPRFIRRLTLARIPISIPPRPYINRNGGNSILACRGGEFFYDSNPLYHMACQLTQFEAYLDLKCGLGEAPFYEEASHSLRFVDINKEKLHTIDLNQGPSSLRTFDLGVAVRLGVTVRY